MARRGWCPVLLLVLAAVLAGCAVQTPDDDASPPGLPRYYDATQLLTALTARQHADRTAQITVQGQVSGQSTMTLAGAGALRIDDGGVSVRLDQDLSRPPAAPTRSGFVAVPGQVYLRSDDGGAPWLRAQSAVTPDDRMCAALASALADSADPTANLARYTDATLIGDADDDTVDGRPTVRYTLVVDLGRAAVLQTDPALRAQLEAQVDDGRTRITSTLWVDAANRSVRTALRQEVPGVGTLTTTGDYHDWGTPVQIDAPSPAEVR